MRALYCVAHQRAVAARRLLDAPDPTRPRPAEVAEQMRVLGVVDASAESVAEFARLSGLPLAPLPPDA